MDALGDVLDMPVRRFLDELASEAPAPGGGFVAALVAAMAAGLVAMVARSSPEWAEARGMLAQAQSLNARLLPLAEEDAAAYEEALAALRLPETLEPGVRNEAIGNALQRAAEVPLQIAAAAADVALLAEEAAGRGEPAIRADAAVAAALAAAAARGSAHLVAINLASFSEDDERVARAQRIADAAAEAATRALAADVAES